MDIKYSLNSKKADSSSNIVTLKLSDALYSKLEKKVIDAKAHLDKLRNEARESLQADPTNDKKKANLERLSKQRKMSKQQLITLILEDILSSNSNYKLKVDVN